MENDIASMYPRMDRNELIYADFIKSRIEKNGGSLKFQHITGQLSQLEHNVRSAIGASPKELMLFLKKYDDLFEIDDNVVSLKSSSRNKGSSAVPKDINVKEKPERESAFPKVINDVPGIVIKVQPTFGFIAVKEPVKASVYFTPSCFNEANKTLMTDLGMVPGKKVRLNARLGNVEFESKYRATKVWIPKNVENEVLHPEGFLPKIPKTRETGLYDADTSEGCGTIQKIFDTYGFIIIDGDQNNTVFFHKNRVCNVENVNDLSKIFQPGDLVDFRAVRSTKQQQRVRWEATKVWIRKKSKIKSKENGESATSDYESISSQSKKSKSPKTSDRSATDRKKTKNKLGLESKEISNETGKIYPSSKGTVIRFGEKDSKLADADSCLFYLHKVKVEDVSWEFSDGDAVKFDGMKIKSPPGYKALLAWVGDKPDVVPIALGDFPEESDEDVSENEGYISKTSSISALSETKKQNIYSSVSSLASNSSKKSRSNRSRSRGNEFSRRSNYNEGKSHSISRNSSKHSHNRSRSRGHEIKRHSDYNEDDSYSVSSNTSRKSYNRSRSRGPDFKSHSNYNEGKSHSASRNSNKHSHNRSKSRGHEINRHSNYNEDDSHSVSSNTSQKSYNRYNSRVDNMKRSSNFNEDDSHSISSNSRSSQGSGYGGNRRRSKSRNSNLKQNYKSNSVNSSHSQLTNCRSKASSVESVNSLSSDIKNKLKPNPDLYKSWGDTPYPDDDDVVAEVDKVHLKAHGREGIQRKNKFSNGNTSSGKSSPCSDEMNKQIETITDDFASKTDLNIDAEVDNKSDPMPSAISSRYAELFLSDGDYSDALEEVNEYTVINDDNDLNEYEDTQTPEEEKPNSYIRRYQDLDGLVKKVFCRYAEIENDKLKKPGTFLWNEMYHNGIPVPDKFDDLKEVLSNGQTVKFNCFELVDDKGTYFVKVTVAWKGSKPKESGMTPEEFIAQNGIVFSGKEISTTEDVVESSCSESMRPLNDESVATAAPRKFLTVASMSDDDTDEENQPPTPVESQVMPLKEDSDCNSNVQEYADLMENVVSNSENMDIPQLTDGISRMLESFKNSEVDSNVVASDIVNIILSTVRARGNQSSQANSAPSVESTETNRRPEMTNSYAQTIITGKIFSESIFTL